MNINCNKNGQTLEVALEGRLDTTTAPELEECMKANWDDVTEIIMDIKALEYVSSAGLRVFLAVQKQMSQKGRFVLKNVGDAIMEVFEITGFADILTIE